MDDSTLDQVGDFSYEELEFEHVDEFPIEYESVLMDDEHEYDVIDFDNVGSVDFVSNVVSICDTFTISLDLKPLPNSLNYPFVGPNESLLVIITSNLNQD